MTHEHARFIVRLSGMKNRGASLYQIILFATLLFWSAWANGQPGLNKASAEKMADSAVAQQRASLRARSESDWKEKQITIHDKTLKFLYKVFGEKPASGRSLYISMHGGGEAPADVNDQQWANQIRLYTPAEGVYVAPRAPTNTWNLWHEDHIDELFEQLIKEAAITEDVDLNKVYIMGYSAGGDGTFQLAPRMADYWAAAAMMAGHPGDASALSLRNLPFAIFMGGLDSAYQRNEHAAEWEKKLDSLQKADPGHYIHDVHIYPDMSHWMKRKDSVAVPWMAAFRRNPLPSKVAWHQDDRLHERFYWLGLPKENIKAHAEAIVSISGNTITIEKNENPVLYVYLNDRMLNLNRKVKVVVAGKKIFKGKVRRDPAIIQETASRMDRDLVFCSRLVIRDGAVSF